MPTSTAMLIYEIVNNKYKVESKILCQIEVFAFSGTSREASCSSGYSALFPKGESLGVEFLRSLKNSFFSFFQKSSLSCCHFLFIWDSETFYLPFSTVMMTLPVIMTFSFFCIFFLSCCLNSEMGHLTSNFELIGSVAVVETSCLSSSELRSLFTHLSLHLCLLFILMFG